jgi:hypothetical protein
VAFTTNFGAATTWVFPALEPFGLGGNALRVGMTFDMSSVLAIGTDLAGIQRVMIWPTPASNGLASIQAVSPFFNPQLNSLAVSGDGTIFAVVGVVGSQALFGSSDGYNWNTLTTPVGTITIPSATAIVVDRFVDRQLVVPVTFNPTASVHGTALLQVSGDYGTTWITLGTENVIGTAAVGTVRLMSVIVPAYWSVQLTAADATIGTASYY